MLMLLLMMKIIFLMLILCLIQRQIQIFGLKVLILWISINMQWLPQSGEFYMDLISLSMTLLTLFLMVLMIIAQYNVILKNLLHIMFMGLSVSLFFTFITSNIFLFYFFFEWSLIPIFIILMVWGYQIERLGAAFCLLFYTLFASLPLLLMILLLMSQGFSDFFPFLSLVKTSIFSFISWLQLLMVILAFLVKFPMYFFHLWLPKAHVEAPVSGSMVLAGILLKLGGYGLIRLSPFFPTSLLIPQICSLSLVGGGVLGIVCLKHSDMKVMIAYSSVVHMSLVIVGVLMGGLWGKEGAMMIMIAHGICSSGLFAGANIMYEKTHSRSLMLNKGVLNYNPYFSPMWMILVVANFGGPFTFNLLGEILLILNLSQVTLPMLSIICLLSLFSAAYSLILYCTTQQGQMSVSSNLICNFFSRETILIFFHLPLLLFLCLSPSLI